MNAKTILAVLLCHVLLTAQTYAIQGGPGGGGGFNSLNILGTYSGVLTGVQEKDPSTGITTASNSIALFSMNVPQTGLASGTSLVFAQGRVFTGTLNASVDPDSGVISGIINANFQFVVPVPTSGNNGTTVIVFVGVTTTAVGKVNATIKAVNGFASNTAARITGTAALQLSFADDPDTNVPIINRAISYTVAGFKQQSTSSTLGTTTVQ